MGPNDRFTSLLDRCYSYGTSDRKVRGGGGGGGGGGHVEST